MDTNHLTVQQFKTFTLRQYKLYNNLQVFNLLSTILLQFLLWIHCIYKACGNKIILLQAWKQCISLQFSAFSALMCLYFFSLFLSLCSRSLEIVWTIVSNAGYCKIWFLCGEEICRIVKIVSQLFEQHKLWFVTAVIHLNAHPQLHIVFHINNYLWYRPEN